MGIDFDIPRELSTFLNAALKIIGDTDIDDWFLMLFVIMLFLTGIFIYIYIYIHNIFHFKRCPHL